VFSIAANGFASYDVSQNGTLVYRGEAALEETTLVWFDRTGRRLETVGAPGVYRGVALSPDNRRIAVHLHQEPEDGDIWVVDRDRATSTRLTFSAHNWRPVWSHDGTSILFSSTRGGDAGSLYRQPSSGLGGPELLVKKGVARAYADDWSADGRSILYSETTNESTGPDIWTLALSDRQPKPKLLIRAEFDQLLAKFSPDRRWIAYESTESGRREIYVQSYGTGGGRWQISHDGGRYVRWARSGQELFYLKDDGSLMVVDVSAQEAAFQSGTPRLLFRANPVLSSHSTGAPLDIPYDVTADGQRFLFTERLRTGAEHIAITVVLNWNVALEK
jgi:eukaryotic-like serine/threonine-protein kinase